ncbi:uncharacterized protein DUF2508 [Alkalibaculum bacchi]|uniref:Uncharacterized protein DUF2508 n=1 Tax=Alkalibaculum bacchi TaxID=645887 RepID=A0A366HWK8_9FIRM|nr:DUF2508 family protein [Alkalibaculum bacchi]RBP57655.1 uncharacterized protein DUF2508 [Alkalibaculum bacchi]
MDKVEKNKKTIIDKKMINQYVQIIKIKIQAFKHKRQAEKERIKTKNQNEHFVSLIEKTKLELEQSKNFFANVTDPDLVDYAAHKILANQYFYNYLLKKAKKENIKAEL